MNGNTQAIADAERIIAEYPRKELAVGCCQVSRDMSVGISNIEEKAIPFDEIHRSERIDFPYVILKALQVTEDHLVIEWRNHGTYELELGQEIKIDTDENGASLTPSVKWLKLSFKYVTLEDKMYEILNKVSDYHARVSPVTTFETHFANTTHDEAVVLRLLDELIARGDMELYVLKAILVASNNWSTGEFVRPSFFRDILLEGVDKGCLSPKSDNAWQWLEIAAENNDPAEFMDDMERYYDILATATEAGNQIARDIMDRIWEPEQIIEED